MSDTRADRLGSPVAEILREAKKLVAAGYCKGASVRSVFGRKCHCPSAALAEAAYRAAEARIVRENRDHFLNHAHDRLIAAANTVNPRGERFGDKIEWISTPTWSDHPRTTKADVLKAFDLAIEDAEKE